MAIFRNWHALKEKPIGTSHNYVSNIILESYFMIVLYFLGFLNQGYFGNFIFADMGCRARQWVVLGQVY